MSDPWGLDEDAVVDVVEVEPAEQLSPPVHCPHCGQLHSTCDERAVELKWAHIRAANRDRLMRTEAALTALSEMERIAVARWLQGVLDRPPLANSRAFDYLRDVIDGLWRDIYWLTPDALTTYEYDGHVVAPGALVQLGDDSWHQVEPHHELADMREGDLVRP